MRTTIMCLMLLGTLLLSSASPAWCNRKDQPGDAEVGETFELPQVVPTVEPFSFSNPDPRRLVRKLQYSLDIQAPTAFQVVVSDRLNQQQAVDVRSSILNLLQKGMCQPADTLVVWSGALRRIATIKNDDRVQDCSQKWLKHKVAANVQEIGRLNRFFEEMKTANHQGRATLNVPHVIHHLGQEFHEFHDYSNRVLVLFGSAIDVSGEEGAALETAYPTVGTLRSELSPFSTRDKAWYLGNIASHFVHMDVLSDRVHRDGLQNFWAAFFLSQGSPLLTFSSDSSIFERVLDPALPVLAAYVDDPNPGYVGVSGGSSIFADFSGSSQPTRLARGSLMVALKWDSPGIDLDLHVGLAGDAERLSYRTPRADFGSLRKDLGTGWEQVFLNREVSPSEIEIWVNFYRGSAPPEGVDAELRVAYAGTLYRRSVHLGADRGNEGKVDSAEHWQEISLRQLLGAR